MQSDARLRHIERLTIHTERAPNISCRFKLARFPYKLSYSVVSLITHGPAIQIATALWACVGVENVILVVHPRAGDASIHRTTLQFAGTDVRWGLTVNRVTWGDDGRIVYRYATRTAVVYAGVGGPIVTGNRNVFHRDR